MLTHTAWFPSSTQKGSTRAALQVFTVQFTASVIVTCIIQPCNKPVCLTAVKDLPRSMFQGASKLSTLSQTAANEDASMLAHYIFVVTSCFCHAGGPPMHRMTAHAAAVKALAWCPFQSNLLASGGGTADRCIKFWNTHTGALLNSIDTGSQVTCLSTRHLSTLHMHMQHSHRLHGLLHDGT